MIASRQNSLVKQMRKLHRAKGRREQNLFLLEGTHLLETACQKNCSLDTVCFTPQWREIHPQLGERAAKQAKRIEMVTPEVLQGIATTVHPDGVVATLSRQVPPVSIGSLRLGLMLERLQDPGNLGAIVRTAVAAKADGLWIGEGSVDIDNPKVLRSSAGAWFHLSMVPCSNLKATMGEFQGQGIQVIATVTQGLKTYWEIDFTHPTLILLGNEGAGLSEELVALADGQVTIPIGEGVESLNVGIAAALLLYEACRQRSLMM